MSNRAAAVHSLLALVLMTMVACTAGKSPAEFDVTSLRVTPSEAVVGERVTVTVDVANVGGTEGTYHAAVFADGAETASKDITLPPGATETLSFSVTSEVPGPHSIAVGGFTTTFKALKPARFEVTALAAEPSEVGAGETVTVVAEVRNVGEAGGTYVASLTVDGDLVEKKEVMVKPGWTEIVSFTFSEDKPGTYGIGLGGVAATVEVLPSTSEIASTTIVPTRTPIPSSLQRPTAVPTPDSSGRILFLSERNLMPPSASPCHPWAGYIMNADGSGVWKVAPGERGECPESEFWWYGRPTWSPDGKRIAFSRDFRHCSLYVADADGLGDTKLTNFDPNASVCDIEPAWSPDGKRIAFTRIQRGIQDVYVINVDGSGLTNLTKHTNSVAFICEEGECLSPTWSPDGKRIAFNKGSEHPDIHVMNADGTSQINLTNDQFNNYFSHWSPDGNRILFICVDYPKESICTIRADGTGLSRLADVPEGVFELAWSPDGTRIAFSSSRSPNVDIFVINADGSGLTHLTKDPATDVSPSWSPDGKRIAFVSERDGNRDIYVINADGSGLARLTNEPWRDRYPVWSPR